MTVLANKKSVVRPKNYPFHDGKAMHDHGRTTVRDWGSEKPLIYGLFTSPPIYRGIQVSMKLTLASREGHPEVPEEMKRAIKVGMFVGVLNEHDALEDSQRALEISNRHRTLGFVSEAGDGFGNAGKLYPSNKEQGDYSIAFARSDDRQAGSIGPVGLRHAERGLHFVPGIVGDVKDLLCVCAVFQRQGDAVGPGLTGELDVDVLVGSSK